MTRDMIQNLNVEQASPQRAGTSSFLPFSTNHKPWIAAAPWQMTTRTAVISISVSNWRTWYFCAWITF
jgi:hypothetical protein